LPNVNLVLVAKQNAREILGRGGATLREGLENFGSPERERVASSQLLPTRPPSDDRALLDARLAALTSLLSERLGYPLEDDSDTAGNATSMNRV
jgi:hypothetical protein